MPFATRPISPLALGLPPSPDNAPPVISIDRTVAMFSLQGARMRKVDDRKDVAVATQRPKIEDEFSEGPRLFRILNLGGNRSTASRRPFVAENKKEVPGAPICPPPPQERTRQQNLSHSSFQYPTQVQPSFVGYTSFDPWGPNPGDEVYLSNKRGPAASLAPNSRRAVTSPQFSKISTLSLEEKIIRRPLPVPRAVPPPRDAENDIPHFTNPFDNDKPLPNPDPLPGVPKDGIINVDDYDLIEDSSWPFLSGYESPSSNEESGKITTDSSPDTSPSFGSGRDLFTKAFDPTSIIQRCRVYPSSTEPDWRVGERWYRSTVAPSAPVFRTAEVEIKSPRPYNWTQSLAIGQMLSEMGCRRD